MKRLPATACAFAFVVAQSSLVLAQQQPVTRDDAAAPVASAAPQVAAPAAPALQPSQAQPQPAQMAVQAPQQPTTAVAPPGSPVIPQPQASPPAVTILPGGYIVQAPPAVSSPSGEVYNQPDARYQGGYRERAPRYRRPAAPRAPRLPQVPSPFALRLDVMALGRLDSGYDIFTATAPTVAAGVSIGRDVANVGSAVTIAVNVGWFNEQLEGRIRERVATRLRSDSFYLDLTARYELQSWLHPHVRVAAGGTLTSVTLDAQEQPFIALGGNVWTGFGSLGAGLGLRTPSGILGDGRLRSVRLNLVVEGGWLLATTAVIDVQPQTAPDSNQIPVQQPTHLGDLSASGPYLRVGAGLLF